MPERSAPQPMTKTEQILVGSWNAIKKVPEAHEKLFMRVYDKHFAPNPKTEAERRIAVKTRATWEKRAKVAGWVATGVEVGVLTALTVKGYKMLREKFPSVPKAEKIKQKVENISPLAKAKSRANVEAIRLTNMRAGRSRTTLENEIIKNPLSTSVKQIVASEYLDEVLAKLIDPDLIARINKASTLSLQNDMLREVMQQVSLPDLINKIHNAPSFINMPGHATMNQKTIEEVGQYVSLFRRWYLANRSPGVSGLGIALKLR